MGKYKGFTTKTYGWCDGNGNKNVSFSIKDLQLVKDDLLNHLFTLRGERVMQPSFGTSIPRLIFEPLDTFILTVVEEEITRVLNYDPRIEMLNLQIQPNYDQNSITIDMVLRYVELNIIEEMNLNIQFE